MDQKIIELLKKDSLKRGSFVLASGKTSSFYLDVKLLALNPKGIDLIGDWVLEHFDLTKFGGVGGPTLGADPLATGISLKAWMKRKIEIPAFIVRKDPKKHGTSQWIEGKPLLDKKRPLLVVEDVVTTGKSSLESITKVREEGFIVEDLFCVVDRNEGGTEALKKSGVKLHSLVSIEQVLKEH
jgi:orotate phosphoribosyltransferase